MSTLSYSYDYVCYAEYVFVLIHGCSSQCIQISFLCSHFKISYLYFYVDKSSQMTHFSCNIPYTAQVYSGKPREGQYSRHHNIKEGIIIIIIFTIKKSAEKQPYSFTTQ